MTENELYELNRLPEIDPDYVPKRVGPAQNEPARIMTKKAWLLSLFFPVLSMLASAVLIIWNLVYTVNGYGFYLIFVTLLGLIVGGIVPTVLIARNRLDTSKYFLGKLIILISSAAAVLLDIMTGGVLDGFILLGFVLAAEFIYALVQKTDIKTKICLFMSSLAWGFLGSALDFWFALTFF